MIKPDLISKDVLSELSSIVGSDDLIVESSALADYAKDMGGFEATPEAVVRAESEEEVVKIVKLADKFGFPIIPRGGGSSLTGAVVGKNVTILDLSKMNRLLKVDTINWYVHCESGLVIDELNKELDRHGFFFPPDPASSFICTVGGVISECSGGMRCVKYGTVKDWVYAVRAVLANGEVIQLGEPLPKNRAGYDLLHLLIGSEGTLAIITQAWLKIMPKPLVSFRRMMVLFDSWDSVAVAIQNFRTSRIVPRIMEFMDRETIMAVKKATGFDLEEAEAILLVDIEEETPRTAETAMEIFQKCGASKIIVAKDKDEEEMFYSARAWAYPAIRNLASGVLVEDVVVPIDQLVHYLGFLKNLALRYGVKVAVNGHAGDGNVHPLILYEKNDAKSSEAAYEVFREICRYAISVGGSTSGEHGIGIQKVHFFREQLISHGGKEALDLMKKLKKLFDPKGILNPGKYVEAA